MLTFIDAARRDFNSAIRSLARTPGFVFAVLATLAVGIGGSLATLSIVDRLLFRGPPGIVDAASVRRVYSRERSVVGPRVSSVFSADDVSDFVAASRGAATIARYREAPSNLALGDSTLRVRLMYADDEYFAPLGVRPLTGRLFLRDEMATALPVAVISEALWRRAFGASPHIVGRVIQIAASPVTVVGVLRGPFQGIDDLDPIDLWMPLAMAPPVIASEPSMSILAKLQNGGTARTLADRFTLQYRRTRKLVVGGDTSAKIVLTPLSQLRGEGWVSPTALRSTALANRLAGVAAAALLVSIGNVIVLFLVRAVRRRRELAVRVALGASRARLLMELLFEGLLLGSLTAVLAGLVGAWCGSLLGSWLLPPTVAGPMVDGSAIAIAALFAVAIASLAGLGPMIIGPPVDGGQALRLDATSGDERGTRLRMGLLVTQVALCVALITVATTFQQSLLRLASTHLGIDREKLITITMFGSGQLPEDVAAGLMARLRALPGVAAVANAGGDLPRTSTARVALPGDRDVPAALTPSYNIVDTAYFNVAGIRLLQGRSLALSDVADYPAVAVVTESMANAFWPGRGPLGECFFGLGNRTRCIRIVGVVGDIRWDLSGPPHPQYYLPQGRYTKGAGNGFVVRTRGPASQAILADVQRIASAMLGNKVRRPAVARVVDRLDPQIRPWKAAATLFTLFGLLALMASAAGVYATVAYEAAQRRTELGVRLALGATLTDLLRVIVRPVAKACATGAAIGLALAIAGGRVIAAFLFDTSPTNALALGIGLTSVIAAALLASLPPSWMVTRLNLANILRT